MYTYLFAWLECQIMSWLLDHSRHRYLWVGRLVVCYLLDDLFIMVFTQLGCLYMHTCHTIGANAGATNGCFFRKPLVAPYSLTFVDLMGFPSLPPMHTLPIPYEMLVTCQPLSASCLLHRSPAIVMDSLTIPAINVNGL